MILLDTHALIWLFEGSDELGAKARRLAEDSWRADGLFVSAISSWEVAMLPRKGRIALDQPVGDWREDLLRMGLTEIAVDGDIAVAAVELGDFHGDPGDRIIVATASRLAAALLTADRRILDWSGALRAQDARR